MKTYGGSYLNSRELRELGVASVGDDVIVHSTCVLAGLENIRFGNHIRVDPFCSLVAAAGSIAIGNHNHVASYVLMIGAEGLVVEDFVSLSRGVTIYTRNDDYTGLAMTGPTVPEEYRRMTKGPVRIGRHAVIGAGCVVLPGVVIGEGVTVGALSLVRSSLDPWGIYAGIPVRRLRERRKTLLAMEAEILRVENKGV